MNRKSTVVLERQGEASPPQTGLAPDEVAQEILGLDGSRDVTLSIRPDGVDEQVMVAVDDSHAFLGWERPDGLRQFATDDHDEGSEPCQFMIGGQESGLRARYLPDVATAAIVVKSWLEGREPSTSGHWERS